MKDSTCFFIFNETLSRIVIFSISSPNNDILIMSWEYAGITSIVSPLTLKFPGINSTSFLSYLALINFLIISFRAISSFFFNVIAISSHSFGEPSE